jgi:hypothetical protein
VVITSRTIAGDPDELSDDQIRVLVESVLGIGRRARCTIERRLRRAAETTNVARDLTADPHAWQQYFHAPAGE